MKIKRQIIVFDAAAYAGRPSWHQQAKGALAGHVQGLVSLFDDCCCDRSKLGVNCHNGGSA